MSFYYQPPVGFGGGVATDPNKKKQPGDPGYAGGGESGGTSLANQQLPGLGYVAQYQQQDFGPAPNIDLSQPVAIPQGSRDQDLMMDSGYNQLLDALGLSERSARENNAFAKGQLEINLGEQRNELARKSQEDRYGIDAVLRSRGVRGTQREALRAKATANEGTQYGNLGKQAADRSNQYDRELANTLSELKRAKATGAGDAAARLQAKVDALLGRQQEAASADEIARQSAINNQQMIDAMNRNAGNANAQNQPVAAGPAPAGELSFAEKLARMTPAERQAWNVFAAGISQPAPAAPAAIGVGGGGYYPSGGGGGGYPAPAPAPAYPTGGINQSTNAAEYRSGVQPIAARPKEPLRPMRGYY